jgi:prepilin-type N-terminal cleavage/methylation domain-containing protein
MNRGPRHPQAGFTLLEILVAVVILVLAMSVIVLTFSNISRAWRDGTTAAANLNHADAILDQLVSGLRSAYYKKTSGDKASLYGFQLEDDGAGSSARDQISWVKTGAALVDPDSPEISTLHRVVFTVADDDRNRPAAAVKAWRPFGQPEEFDPEKDAPFFFISSSVQGFDCEISTNISSFGEIEWEEAWEETNRIPLHVHLSLYLKPSSKSEEPMKVERIVTIPIAPLSW